MELATAIVALGGDKGNTVPVYDMTPAQALVLMRIHGDDAVRDIDPTGDVSRSSREEMQRLLGLYGASKTEDLKPVVQEVFPGSGAALPQTFWDLGLSEALYKPTARARPAPAPEPEEVEDPVPQARSAGARKTKAEKPAPVAPAPAPNDITDDVFAET